MRQYERYDCGPFAYPGQRIFIDRFYKPAFIGGECDIVVAFFDERTQQSTWVPWGSKVQLSGTEYTVLRGALDNDCSDRGFTAGQSVCCLRDPAGQLEPMDPYNGIRGTVLEVNRSRIDALKAYLFDVRHLKASPMAPTEGSTREFYEPHLETRLRTYGILR